MDPRFSCVSQLQHPEFKSITLGAVPIRSVPTRGHECFGLGIYLHVQLVRDEVESRSLWGLAELLE